MDRRSFLISAAAGIQGTVTGEAVQAESQEQYRPPDWLRYCRVIYFDGYTPPVHPHIRDFDARKLVECVGKLGGDTLRFQPIGYFAYYPSKRFPIHPDLAGRDLMDEVARECRRQDVHVFCYCPYMVYFASVEWLAQHEEYADWVRRGPDGKPAGSVTHHGWAHAQHLCIFGDTYRKAIRQIVREYCAYDIDGIYFDAPSTFSYSGFCFCDTCRRNYKSHSGFDIDRLHDPNDLEAQVAWYDWGNQCTREDLADFRAIVHGARKFMLCHNGSSWTGTALRAQYRVPDGFMIEHTPQTYARLMHGMMGASMARPSMAVSLMYLGNNSVTSGNQPPHVKPWATHCTNLEDSDEIRMDGFANIASGGMPLYATLNRVYYGIGGGSTEPAREVYDLLRRCEGLLKDSVPVPYVSVVPTWESLQRWRVGGASFNFQMSEGFFLAMLDSGVSVDVCPSTEISPEWLSNQRVVALCGASGIEDEQARLLTNWVRNGGRLLTTYDTGLYDEKGRLRSDGGALREALGVEMAGEPGAALPDTYYRVGAPHPALAGYSPGAMIQGDNRTVPVRLTGDAVALADCWNLGEARSLGPGIVLNRFGRGRVIYVNGSLEAYYPVSRVSSTRRVLESLVRHLGDAALPFRLSAPMGVYGVLRRAKNGDLVLWVLAPLGFKDAATGLMRQQFVPVRNVEVRVRVPEGRRVKAVNLARAAKTLPHTVSDGYALVKLPEVHIAELLQFQLA